MRASWSMTAVLLIAAAPAASRANPCPCNETEMSGRTLLTGTPLRDVSIADETLSFKVQRPSEWRQMISVEISVRYTLVNRGPARDIVIGFPTGDASLSSFEVRGDGVGARVLPDAEQRAVMLTQALPTECEMGRNDDRFQWYLWRQHLSAGSTSLHVRYLQRWSTANGGVTIDFVLRTARTWGDGRIGKLRIDLDDPDKVRHQLWRANLRPSSVVSGGRHLLWSMTRFRPKSDLQLTLEWEEKGQERD